MDAQFLGQQQLLQPPARRRIIVAPGHGAWWGIDPSTVRVSVAYIASDGARGVRTAPFPRSDGAARLSGIYAETVRFVVECASWGYGTFPAPGLVLVEQPSGKSENPNLSYAVGVIQAAVFDALYSHFRRAVQIETCTSSWWKKRACGSGAIFKPKRGSGEKYGVLTWAQENGYAGSSWDEADALGIAEAARREVALEER
jgi:hypothetical protein